MHQRQCVMLASCAVLYAGLAPLTRISHVSHICQSWKMSPLLPPWKMVFRCKKVVGRLVATPQLYNAMLQHNFLCYQCLSAKSLVPALEIVTDIFDGTGFLTCHAWHVDMVCYMPALHVETYTFTPHAVPKAVNRTLN